MSFFRKLEQCYIIAEIGVNHNGDMTLAKEMILEAKNCGADAVKFQTFQAKKLVTPNTPKVKYQKVTTESNETHFEMINKLEFKHADHYLIKKFNEKNNIDFLSTAYDVESAIFLNEELNIKMFKTASADLVDLPLHEYIAKTGKPTRRAF